MKKLTIVRMGFLLAVFLAQNSTAQSSDDRLMQLVQKKADLQATGQDLDQKDSDEFSKLATARGIVATAEMQSQVKAQTTQSSTNQNTALLNPTLQAPQGGATSNQKTAQQQAYQNHQDQVAANSTPVTPAQSTNPAPMYTLKTQSSDQSISQPAAPQPAQKAMNPASVSSTDFVEQKNLGADSVQGARTQAQAAPKPAKKKELSEAIDPNYSKRLKKEVAQITEMRKNMVDLKKTTTPVNIDTKSKGAIYDPVPSDPGVKQTGFVVDRDSTTIITKRVGTKDAVTIKMCIAYGVSIILDESIDTELQRIILDDKIFFDAQEFENHRGAYVRLTKPIPDGNRWESAIRLVRKSDDRTYLINLIGVGCPEGNVDYPKVVYLKEKYDVLSSRQGDVMTPEDMIIQASQGLPRKNMHEVKVYDMVASPGSDWVVFGVEIEGASISKPDKIEFAALDNLQINKLNVRAEYMKLQSDKSTELRGSPSYRYKVMMAIDKAYMFKNRFVHLVYINKETKHYQYIEIDTLQYFKSLKDRGFDL